MAHLDSFLIGTVAKSPSMSGYGLTTKVEGKTVTLYVRKNLVPKALEMGRRYKQLWTLIQKLFRLCSISSCGDLEKITPSENQGPSFAEQINNDVRTTREVINLAGTIAL